MVGKMTDAPPIELTRKQREKLDRRNSIIDAAEKVFSKKGVEATTMDDVAEAAEFSKGTLYSYFSSKDDLFLAVASRPLIQFIEQLELISQSDKVARDKLRQVVLCYEQFVVKNNYHFRTAISDLASGRHLDVSTPEFAHHRGCVNKIIDALVAIVEIGKKKGEIHTTISPFETATNIWGAMIGNFLIYVNYSELQRRFPRGTDASQLVPGLIAILCDGLCTKRGQN